MALIVANRDVHSDWRRRKRNRRRQCKSEEELSFLLKKAGGVRASSWRARPVTRARGERRCAETHVPPLQNGALFCAISSLALSREKSMERVIVTRARTDIRNRCPRCAVSDFVA